MLNGNGISPIGDYLLCYGDLNAKIGIYTIFTFPSQENNSVISLETQFLAS